MGLTILTLIITLNTPTWPWSPLSWALPFMHILTFAWQLLTDADESWKEGDDELERSDRGQSGYCGVRWKASSKKWQTFTPAGYCTPGKPTSVGLFSSPIQAARARRKYMQDNPSHHNYVPQCRSQVPAEAHLQGVVLVGRLECNSPMLISSRLILPFLPSSSLHHNDLQWPSVTLAFALSRRRRRRRAGSKQPLARQCKVSQTRANCA